jgi:hypothetical protein
MGLCSIIPAKKGRQRKSGRPSGRYRRLMQQRFARDGGGPQYRQRAQVETVNSMIKRNLGSHLRCRTPGCRELELLLRVIVHNVMLIRRHRRGSRQSRTSGSVSTFRIGAARFWTSGYRLQDGDLQESTEGDADGL